MSDVCAVSPSWHGGFGHQSVHPCATGWTKIIPAFPHSSKISQNEPLGKDCGVCVCVCQAALRLGLSHAPLATTALDALESWSSFITSSIIQPHYIDILPQLDGYLKTGTSNGEKTLTYSACVGFNSNTNANSVILFVNVFSSSVSIIYEKDCTQYFTYVEICPVSDKDESSMSVMFVSSSTAKGYGKVMMRLLKKSKHLPMVTCIQEAQYSVSAFMGYTYTQTRHLSDNTLSFRVPVQF